MEATVYTREQLIRTSIHDLRVIVRTEFGGTPGGNNKEQLIEMVINFQKTGQVPKRNPRGRKCLDRVENFRSEEQRTVNTADFVNVKVSDAEFQQAETEESEEESESAKQEEISETKAESAESSDSVKESNAVGRVEGVLELHMDGYGFLRAHNYESTSRDTFVARPVVKRYNLRRGDYIKGSAERLRENESPALKCVFSVNGLEPEKLGYRKNFDDLIPYYPTERITLETKNSCDDLAIRCMDLFCPIGKGQRGLIVSPPKAGKTTLLKKIAASVEENYPDINLIVLLIDERPEEVTDLKRSVKGEVVYSTFDESPEHHIRAAELVLWRAKRLVEMGKDVVILLDSLTRLARAYNSSVPSSGKTLSGGIDPVALQSPKKFFGAARNIEGGGSLTIVATALIDTGSKMDDIIYEEFKGTGNMEIHLSRELSERRIFPAIDLYRSGTRKDELLLSDSEIDCVFKVRRIFNEDQKASENVLDMMKKTSSNAEFVSKMPAWIKLFKGD